MNKKLFFLPKFNYCDLQGHADMSDFNHIFVD